MELSNSISKSIRNLRNRVVSSQPRQASAPDNPSNTRPRYKPSDRVLDHVLRTSTPDNSSESPPTLEDIPEPLHPQTTHADQDPETPHTSIEEVQGDSNVKGRPPSQDSLDDGRCLDMRVQEIRSSIDYLKGIRTHPEYLKIAPPLHADLVDKIHKLSEYITLHQLSTTFNPEILKHMNTAAEIRLTFSERPSPTTRRRSHSEGDQSPQSPNHLTSQTTSGPFVSQFAQTLHRKSIAQDADNNVFEPSSQPIVAQPRGSSSGLSDQYIRDHSFSAENQLSVVVNRLTERLVDAESKWEIEGEQLKEKVGNLASNYDILARNANRVKRQLSDHSKEVASLQNFIKTEVQNELMALRSRCHLLETMPAPSEVVALRTEVNKLRSEVAGLVTSQDLTLNPKLGTIIAGAMGTFQADHVDPISERVKKLETSHISQECSTKFDALIRVTNRLRTDVKTLKSSSINSSASPQTHLQDSTLLQSASISKTMGNYKPPTSHSLAPGESLTCNSSSYIKRDLYDKLKKLEGVVGGTGKDGWKSDFQQIQHRHAADRPQVVKLIDLTYGLFSQISKSNGMDDSCFEKFQSTIDKAEAWVKELDSLHHDVVVTTSGQSANIANSTVQITAFSGNAAQNVYEFLSDFEAAYLHVGNNKQRATRLYRHHLVESVRIHCISSSESYPDLRAWLISKYGNVTVILNQMVGALEATSKPNNSDTSARLAYFSKWTQFFFRTDLLAKNEDIDTADVKPQPLTNY